MSRRWLFLVPLVALLATLVPACSPSKGAGGTTTGPELRCVLDADPEKLDPATMTGVPEGRIAFNVFEGLWMPTVDGSAPVVTYGAAESHKVSEDGTVWTITLRGDGKWHNGDPVTAQDFAYAWQRVITPATGADYANLFDVIKGAEAYRKGESTDWESVGIKVKDDRTLEVTLAYACPYFPQLTAFYTWFPVHRGTVEKHGDDWTRAENYVGNGPYRLVEFKSRQHVLLEKFDGFHAADTVRVERVRMPILVDDEARLNEFKQGNVDLLLTVPPDRISEFKGTPEFRMGEMLGTYYYRVNLDAEGAKPLADVRVRQALSLAINRSDICDKLLNGVYPKATTFVPPMPGYEPIAHIESDARKARELLAEAGFEGGQGFPKLTLLFNENETHRRIAVNIQDTWKKVLGIDIELQNVEWKTYLDRIDKQDYQIGRAGWIGDWEWPDTFLNIFKTGDGNNDTGWGNEEYDRLVEESKRVAPEESMKLLAQAEKILLEELPIMPIYYYKRPILVAQRVTDYKSHPRGIVQFRYYGLKAE